MINSGIYKITHRETGRIYIGQSTNLRHRKITYKSSGGSGNGNSVIKRAIKKYGWDAFDWDVILYAEGYDYLNDIEAKLIDFYGCLVPNGFNVEIGGKNSPCPEIVKKAISKANTGRVFTEEQRKKMSEGQKKRIANMTDEQKANLAELGRNINLGKKLSEEHKQKVSKTRKERIDLGLIKPARNMLGFKHSEETKAKMSASRTGQKRTPEQIERFKEASKKRWQNPEYRAKVLAAKGVSLCI